MRRLSLLLIPLVVLALLCRPASADEKDVRATVEKAIKAHGGADKLNKYLGVTSTLKGKIDFMGMNLDFTGEMASQIPDKLKVSMDVTAGNVTFKVVEVVNKDRGWTKLDDTLEKMDKDELAEAREELHVTTVTTQLTPLLKKEYTLSGLGDVRVDGKPAVGVRVTRKGYRDINLYFDAKTMLLAKVEHRVKDDQGQEVAEETYYSDYKDVSGMKAPHTLKVKRDGKDYLDATLGDVKVQEKLPEDTFAKP